MQQQQVPALSLMQLSAFFHIGEETAAQTRVSWVTAVRGRGHSLFRSLTQQQISQ